MEAIEMIPTIEAPPVLEPIPPMRVTGSIFLPMFTTRNGALHVITLQTFGRQMRYFTNPNDPVLANYLRYIAGSKTVKKAAPITLGEFYTWEVSYFIGSTQEVYYLNTPENWAQNQIGHGVVSTPVIKMDDLFKLEAPLEFKVAVLNVAFKELGKN